MHQNNTVYKGYLLTARVERQPDTDSDTSPRFSATVSIAPADMIQRFADVYVVPRFANGLYAESPRDAVHEAIDHGLEIVSAIQSASNGV